MRRGAALVVVVALLVLAASCKPRPIVGKTFCEFGIHAHNPNGGECFVITADKLDADPATIGTASWTREDRERYSVRRVAEGKGKYSLYLGGDVIGAIEPGDLADAIRVTVRHTPPNRGIETGTYDMRER